MSGCDINLLYLQAFDPMVTEGLGFAGILDGLLVVHLFPFVSKVETLLMHELTAFLRSKRDFANIYWHIGFKGTHLSNVAGVWGESHPSIHHEIPSSWAYNDDHPDETKFETASCKAVSVVTSDKLKVPRVIST